MPRIAHLSASFALACFLAVPTALFTAESEGNVPTEEVKEIPPSERGFFGLHVIPQGDFSGAMEVRQVIPGSSAAEAGIQIYDKLVSINGIPTTKRSDLKSSCPPCPLAVSFPLSLNAKNNKWS